jgi:PAS domain S-box-containing protein
LTLAPTQHPFLGSPGLAAEIVATVHEPLAVLDAELCVVAASPAFFRRFALVRECSLGASIFDLGCGEWDTPGARELLEFVAPRREVVEDYALEVRTPGADRPRVQVTVRPLREEHNRLAGMLLGFRELAPDPKTPAESLLQRAGRPARDLVVVLDAEGRFLAVEGGARELVGRSAGELQGMRIEELLHPSERQGTLAALHGLLAGEPYLRTVFRLVHRDGGYVWAEALCHAWTPEGSPPLLHLVVRDVGERKRMEEALRWLSMQTRLILDSAPEGIFGVDPAGTITFLNPAAARALGYRVPELLGKPYHALLVGALDASLASSSDPVGMSLRDGVGRSTRTELRAADGTAVPVELSTSGSRAQERGIGAVVTFRPIAEQLREEAATRRAEWLAGVGETAIGIRHEVNNPLTALLAEARLLEMGGNTPEEEREMIASICGQARRIGEVIRRLAERQDEPTVRVDGNTRMLDLSA